MSKPKPVCDVCRDTHQMTLHRSNGDEQVVMCTSCPTPCDACRSRGPGRAGGPFCATTPCPCACHADSFAYRGRGATSLPPIPDAELDLGIVGGDVGRILKRAGVPADCLATLAGAEKSSDPIARELRAVARLLLVDAVREDARWTARVKRLETRIDFAVDALRGGGERG